MNDAASVAPSAVYTGSGLVFTYRRTDLANTDPSATISVVYSTDLVTWTQAQNGVNGVTIATADNFYAPSPAGIDKVEVTLPSSLAVGGKLFARLSVAGLPTTLLNANFESSNGGFTVATTGGSAWEYGAPTTPNPGGGSVTSGNSGTKCWGTNLNDVYAALTETKLRSPVIDLTGITTATLSFAEAIDIKSGHTLVVNVIAEATDTVLQSAIHTSTPDLNTSAAPWTAVTAATPITGGQKVRIEWHFTGDGDGFYLGAYIDNVVIKTP